MTTRKPLKNLEDFIDAISTLRGPDGCPWDREQDHKTLKKYLLNESYELIDAIDSGQPDEICEELGDVLLQVILHSQIASEKGQFDIEDVARQIKEKIIHRHPHVFGDKTVKNADEVVVNWEAIKNKEKTERDSALDGVPRSAPALMRAEQLSKKAVAVGFEWPDIEMLWDTFYSEIDEFKQAINSRNKDRIKDEMGDMLFCIVNLARWYKIDPEMALQESNNKFISRFNLMEKNAGKNLTEFTQPELEELWQEAKKTFK
ncbi:MAG: nucleoside triphosphate pyrophosphohydrolase [Cyanobacteriota bacterium]